MGKGALFPLVGLLRLLVSGVEDGGLALFCFLHAAYPRKEGEGRGSGNRAKPEIDGRVDVGLHRRVAFRRDENRATFHGGEQSERLLPRAPPLTVCFANQLDLGDEFTKRFALRAFFRLVPSLRENLEIAEQKREE